MTVQIESFAFDTIIGILDSERTTPQKVIVDIEIDYEYKNGEFVDYAKVCELIRNEIVGGKYGLIEDALEEILPKVLHFSHLISSVKMKITKPNILPDAVVSVQKRLIKES